MAKDTQLVCLRLDQEMLSGLDELIKSREFDTRAAAIRYAINQMLINGGRK